MQASLDGNAWTDVAGNLTSDEKISPLVYRATSGAQTVNSLKLNANLRCYAKGLHIFVREITRNN